jgi:ubiquinone/menaquinone biosynthesis C-methylase UbiE
MDMEALAAQLCKPEGEGGRAVATMMARGNQRIIEWSIDALQLRDKDRVLEIGMGNAAFVTPILAHSPTITYTGCDHSLLMVEEARQLNAASIAAGRARFDLGEAAFLPYGDAAFSKILTVNTLYFWGDAVAALREVKRVLHRTGLFVIGIRSERAMKQMPFTAFGFRKYSEEALARLVRDNGFHILNSSCREEPPYHFEGTVMTLENIIVTCSTG